MKTTINDNLRTAAGILHSDISNRQWGQIKSVEGIYKGRKIIAEYHSLSQRRMIYVKTVLQLPEQGDKKRMDWFSKISQISFCKPTKFTNMIGNEIFYGESNQNDRTNFEWQQKRLSQEEVILMFDRLVEGVDVVESGRPHYRG